MLLDAFIIRLNCKIEDRKKKQKKNKNHKI